MLRSCSTPASAFGWLAAPQDLALLAETLRATIKPDAPFELVRKHFPVSLCLQEYGRSSGPAQPRPGFAAMPADCQSVGTWWSNTVALLPPLRSVLSGCRRCGIAELAAWVEMHLPRSCWPAHVPEVCVTVAVLLELPEPGERPRATDYGVLRTVWVPAPQF